MAEIHMPLYIQVYEDIKKKIQNRDFKEGEKLPSERALSIKYDVSRITIREALKHLEEKQYIKIEHGKGSYVLSNQYIQKLDNLYSFKEEIEKSGDTPRTIMLSIKEICPPCYVRERMELAEYQKVFELRRLRLANENPLIYETTYLPVKYCEGLTQFDFNQLSLYDTLNKHYNIQIDKAFEYLSSKKMNEKEATFLEADSNDVCMFIERFSYFKGNMIEYTESVAKARDYKYTVNLI